MRPQAANPVLAAMAARRAVVPGHMTAPTKCAISAPEQLIRRHEAST